MGKRINHGKHYTNDEFQYIIENLFYTPLDIIARRLGRPIKGVREVLAKSGVKKTRTVDGCYTKPEIANMLSIHEYSLRKAVKDGRLKSEIYADAAMKVKLFSIKDIRNFIINSRQLNTRTYKCLHCNQDIIGDLYCKKHLPPEVGLLRKYSKDVIDIKISDKKAMGAALRARRLELGLSGPQASELMGYDNSNLSRLERAERGFTFDNLHHTFNTLGCTVKIVIEKGPFVNG